tara:strand:+ start:88 stop:675 length:588 start_codon:yes stop_codon:yes gene_type:complete
MGYKLGILISGNGSNMLNIIEASKKKLIKSKVATVVSNNPLALGIQKASKKGIDVKIINQKKYSHIYDFESSLSKYLLKKRVDLICLAGFMRVLSKDFVKKWNNKIINIHPSLLPAFKGLNTHERAIREGVRFSGCTVHFVSNKVDSGKIIDQEIVKVFKSDNAVSLQKKILMKEHKLYIKVLNYLEKNNGQIRQ